MLHLKRIEVALAKVCWRLVTICLHSAVVALSRAVKATSIVAMGIMKERTGAVHDCPTIEAHKAMFVKIGWH